MFFSCTEVIYASMVRNSKPFFIILSLLYFYLFFPQVKEFIHTELLAHLYSSGDNSALMNESPEQAMHREHVLQTHSALKEALSILSEISTSTLTTLFSPPGESPRIQSSIINRR